MATTKAKLAREFSYFTMLKGSTPEEGAEADCVDRNSRAEKMGIDARYVVNTND